MKFEFGPDLRGLQDTPEDFAVLVHVLDLIKTEMDLHWYADKPHALEFGVATGTTLGLIADIMPVTGFDSFEGLPEDWRTGFPKGKFADKYPATVPDTATLVKGWFKDTVPGYDWPENVALVHIDCDLYSSTMTVLDQMYVSEVVKPGCFIVFDEFFGYPGAEHHEQRAFEEFLTMTEFDYEVIGHGREQWAIRLK